MKTNYGNSFNHGKTEVGADMIALWPKVDEFYPAGAYLAPDETYTVGTKIPAGTPVGVDKIGGTVTLNGEAPTGLTYEDAYMGANGCTLTIVTKGQINESVCEAEITAEQKEVLKCITFVNV